MNPYRSESIILLTQPTSFFSLFKRIKRWYQNKLIKYHGSYLKRYPIKCPKCNKRSWNPADQFNKPIKFARFAVNYYRCGHAYNDSFFRYILHKSKACTFCINPGCVKHYFV